MAHVSVPFSYFSSEASRLNFQAELESRRDQVAGDPRHGSRSQIEQRVEQAASSSAAASSSIASNASAPPSPLRLLHIVMRSEPAPQHAPPVVSLLERRMARVAQRAAALGIVTMSPSTPPLPSRPRLHAHTVPDLFLESLAGNDQLPSRLRAHCRGSGPVVPDSVLVPARRELHALKSRAALFDAMLMEEWTSRLSGLGPIPETLMHMLNHWMGIAGFLEGWLAAAPSKIVRQGPVKTTMRYLEQLQVNKSTFQKICSRLSLCGEGIQLAREQRLTAIEKWEVVQPLLTLMPASKPLSLASLLRAEMPQIKRMVIVATAIVLLENSVDWDAALGAATDASVMRQLADRLHPEVATGLAGLGLEPYDILVRLVQHPLVILKNCGILPEHLQDLMSTDQKLILQYPWAFVAACQTWGHVPSALKNRELWDAAAVIEEIWACRREAWEGSIQALEDFAATASSTREIRFIGAIPEPSDLTTPSTVAYRTRQLHPSRGHSRQDQGVAQAAAQSSMSAAPHEDEG